MLSHLLFWILKLGCCARNVKNAKTNQNSILARLKVDYWYIAVPLQCSVCEDVSHSENNLQLVRSLVIWDWTDCQGFSRGRREAKTVTIRLEKSEIGSKQAKFILTVWNTWKQREMQPSFHHNGEKHCSENSPPPPLIQREGSFWNFHWSCTLHDPGYNPKAALDVGGNGN